MNISVKKSQNDIYLVLEGEITVSEGERIKETLCKNLTMEKAIEVDLERVTLIDTAGLQLLYAACQTASQKGIPFFLKNQSSAFTQAVNLMGLSFQTQKGSLLENRG